MRVLSSCLIVVLCLAANVAEAAGETALSISIRQHKFEPAEIVAPANTRIALTVSNDDATPEEIESRELRIEKVIPGKARGVVRIGPLKPGRYAFFGEFHHDTAQGALVIE